MASPGHLTSSLALWLHLRRRRGQIPAAPEAIALPSGQGPVMLIHLAAQADDPPAVAGLVRAMRAMRPALRFVITGALPPEDVMAPGLGAVHVPVPQHLAEADRLLDRIAPRALLLLGDDLPSALISRMAERDLPVILAEARLSDVSRVGNWRMIVNRGLMQRITRVMAPDLTAGSAARQLGVRADRIELTGPVTETLPPLSVNEAERAALAQILRGRHVWLAATPSLPEIPALLAAHQAALHHNHRALLILAGLPAALVPDIRAEAEALGLATVLRSDDEDPEADDQVLIADDAFEMGLWYRLAPVCFMGGTLSPGPALEPRHPFEPAALGSAIIHGPLTAAHAAEWIQLDGASAARLITDGDTLTRAVSDLTAPDQAAVLAGNAWSVSTGGAAVTRRIAETVIEAMETGQ
ncbi:3-deoxy-D-manno-octulosonic acid transferase [Paracoccus ravus]|uniref:3-deoxy-D-manno-octulosonic acid transferase n=1 Tax=Paracoccus ravus TaxID=2447760 RepID=UPI00106E9A2E|nr:glycosyltransferase N-terminal domain-containing protein [Paracoccus ravus]